MFSGRGARAGEHLGRAFVVAAPDAPVPTLDELRDWCRARLADYKSLDRLAVVEELPVNGMHELDEQARPAAITKEHV